MRLIPLALLLLAQSACASNFVRAKDVTATFVVWEQQSPQNCTRLPYTYGCALRMFDYGLCIIELPEDAPDWAIAEEFKHCFGYEHRENFK